jgi:hypothetical protein
LRASEWWLQRRRIQCGINQINTESESASGDSAALEQFPETLHNVIKNGENKYEKLYNSDKTAHYYKQHASKSFHLKKSTPKRGYES